MCTELKKSIEADTLFGEKLAFPSFKASPPPNFDLSKVTYPAHSHPAASLDDLPRNVLGVQAAKLDPERRLSQNLSRYGIWRLALLSSRVLLSENHQYPSLV